MPERFSIWQTIKDVLLFPNLCWSEIDPNQLRFVTRRHKNAGRWVRYEALSQGLYGIMFFVMKG